MQILKPQNPKPETLNPKPLNCSNNPVPLNHQTVRQVGAVQVLDGRSPGTTPYYARTASRSAEVPNFLAPAIFGCCSGCVIGLTAETLNLEP